MTLAAYAVLRTDGTRLFDPLNLTFGTGCIGLVGRNGCGKSTLLRAIGGEKLPSEGSLSTAGSVWTLPQIMSVAPDQTVADLLGVREPLSVLSRILDGAAEEDDLDVADWTLHERIEKALHQVGLTGLSEQTPVDRLSGGEQTRVYLAAMTLARPDVVLLDEPTNHLDANGRARVLELIAGWTGCMLVVSHDRAILDQVEGIVELSPAGGKLYGGNYSHYWAQRELERGAAEAAAQGARQNLKTLNRDAHEARDKRAQRASAGRREGQSNSLPRLSMGLRKSAAQHSAGRAAVLSAKRLAEGQIRLEQAEQALERVRALDIPLVPTGLMAGSEVLSFEGVSVDRGKGPVFAPLDLYIRGPERVCVTGANGSGKSTLLHVVSGAIVPTSGRASIATKPILLDQHVSILKDEETLRDGWLRLNPEGTPEEAQAALARFLFRNTAALKCVGELSGGERVRAGLACTVAGKTPARFLLLDEPTNHLDLDAVSAVEQVLRDYDGALMIVSHDRHFLDAIGIDREVGL